MVSEPSILLAIKPQHYQGQQLLKENWLPVLAELRDRLQECGFEEGDSSETLLLFTFSHPFAAITVLSHFIDKTRARLDEQNKKQLLPLQIIVHLSPVDEITTPYRNHEAEVWEFLSPESIHITRTLKSSWDLLMAQKPLPHCTLSPEDNGLFKLQMQEAVKADPLITCRGLPTQGPERPCFYCGMQSHQPGQCPSKFLTMDHNGLAAVGYLSFEQLNLLYKKVFANQEAMTELLAGGITPSQIRRTPELMVFVSFFDINWVYQPRFLHNVTYSRHSKWQAVFKSELLPPDNKNLQLGLDCLRVGKYSQAEAFLKQEFQSVSTRRFSAAIGLAFVALEQHGLADIRTPLELARSMAAQPKEQIYITLLLSRFYDLIGETSKAREIIKNLLVAEFDCPDARYRKMQLEAKSNSSEEACQLLHTLMIDQRTFYMAALMDPVLLPIQAKVEDLLSTQYGVKASNAKESLIEATNAMSDLTLWFDSHDPQMEANMTILANLHKRSERKSYFDMLDVEHKAKVQLAAICQLREDKLNALYEQIKTAEVGWGGIYRFWAGYRYQFFFKEFERRLRPLEKALQEVGLLAKKNDGETYQKSVQIMRGIEQTLAELKHMQVKMNLVTMFCDSTISFTKKLALTEIAGAILANGLIFGLGQLPEGNGLAVLVNDPLFQRKAFIMTTFILAPLLALSWTITDQLQN